MSLITDDALSYLRDVSSQLIEGGAVPSDDGTTRLFTPDGHGNYRALWTRDFTYMVQYAGDLMDGEDVHRAIEFLIAGQSDEGVVPDRVAPDGHPIYVAGPESGPIGQFNLDNAQFLVIAAHAYLTTHAEDPQPVFSMWSEALERGMASIPRTARGLVGNNPLKPHSPYGFTDTIGKTGELLKESLLFREASLRLAEMHDAWGDPTAAERHRTEAEHIEQNLDVLWDEETGMFLAATADCRQIDIWGSSYALYTGVPLGRQADRILDFLAGRYDDCVYKGQIRHIPRGEHWQRLLCDVQPERYQNGAYWATASGWVLWSLVRKDAELAERLLIDLLDDFRRDGICECINTDYRQLSEYVVSATNVYGAAKRLRDEGY